MSYTIFFDTETGGVTPDKPTIQLAAIAIEDIGFAEVGSIELKLQFDEAKADPEALAMNHYDKSIWEKEALPPSVAKQRFDFWARPYQSVQMISKAGRPYTVGKLAGYNALTFDLPRLRELYGAAFFPFTFHVRDVLQRVLFYFDEHKVEKPKDFKLGTVCEYFNIKVDGAHDALVDVRLTAKLLKRLRG